MNNKELQSKLLLEACKLLGNSDYVLTEGILSPMHTYYVIENMYTRKEKNEDIESPDSVSRRISNSSTRYGAKELKSLIEYKLSSEGYIKGNTFTKRKSKLDLTFYLFAVSSKDAESSPQTYDDDKTCKMAHIKKVQKVEYKGKYTIDELAKKIGLTVVDAEDDSIERKKCYSLALKEIKTIKSKYISTSTDQSELNAFINGEEDMLLISDIFIEEDDLADSVEYTNKLIGQIGDVCKSFNSKKYPYIIEQDWDKNDGMIYIKKRK